MDYKIIVDSCCDMTPQLKKWLEATLVPLTMRLGNKEFTDDDSLDLEQFMQEMKDCEERVESASPGPYLYQQAIENAGQSFVVTLSSQLSGSYENAVMGSNFAKENNEADAHVFDSKSASAGQALVAIKIKELIMNGMSVHNIIQTVNKFIDNMKTYFVLENYDNLIKNGRLSRIKERIIRVMNIKLVMGSDGNGNIDLFAKIRGVKQMVDKLTSFIESSGKKTDGENLVISHCNNMEYAEMLRDAVKRKFHFKEIFIIPTGGLSSLYADDKGIIMAF